jgi:hypothetical protein
MRLRRDVLIAVLATFCLTSALFTVKPSGSQSTLSYNPWMDTNDDGRIDIYDVVSVTAIYGKTGDPTKNVNVTNWPIDEQGNLKVNVMPRGNLTLCTDSQTITVADCRVNEWSLTVSKPWNEFGWDLVFHSYFSFSPKKGFHNVTRVIIKAVIGADRSSTINFSFWVSDIDLYLGICFQYCYGVSQSPWEIQFIVDKWTIPYLLPVPNVTGKQLLESIKPGINFVRINGKLGYGAPACRVYVYKVEVLIEYTYWDYIE